ncbi:hypothetical protein [Halomonas sp.]|uniref:hypothetical protein n=1 Tax=Halomonas sp. TaxID=1486246 RepID=UPI00356A5985
MFHRRNLLASLVFVGLVTTGQALAADPGIERLTSDQGIDAVDERLRAALEERGMTLMSARR